MEEHPETTIEVGRENQQQFADEDQQKFADLNLSRKEISYLNLAWRSIVDAIGYLLILFFYLLCYVIFASFVYDTCLLYYLNFQSWFLTSFILVVGVGCGFNLIFQHALAVLVPAGFTNTLFRAHYQAKSQDETVPFIYDPTLTEYNKSMMYVPLDSSILKYCTKCKLPKPPRTHHCSMCDRCVLKMDHHCPWIRGCVGYQNHRHFALFLFWVWASTGYVTLLNLPIIIMEDFDEFEVLQSEWFQIAWPLDLVICITMAFFAGWSWYLILVGTTTIEFWESKIRQRNGETKGDKARRDYKANLTVVFGDFKHLYEIFLPSVGELTSNGVIWSLKNKNVSDEEEQIKEHQDDIKQEKPQEQISINKEKEQIDECELL